MTQKKYLEHLTNILLPLEVHVLLLHIFFSETERARPNIPRKVPNDAFFATLLQSLRNAWQTRLNLCQMERQLALAT